ncbi:MAG: diguanylate cyclase [Sulfurimicrobium sp.]|nr:diguanylate cyclase [Sulfurimicrobium sp.]MDP2197402.1 diguanylate cyclase [Sulfurimicrobium sp.]
MNSGPFAPDMPGSEGLPYEAGLYQRYLEALGRVTSLLLEDTGEDSWGEVLQLLAEASRAKHCALYLNQQSADGCQQAMLRSFWPSPSADAGLQRLDYDEYVLLNDTLQIGMVLTRNTVELPTPEFNLFRGLHSASVMCIPLLVGGEMSGFLGFFSQREKHDWLPMEIDILCVAANNFSAMLARQRMEHSLRASESRLRVLVGATEDIVIEFDAGGEIHNVWSDHGLLPSATGPGKFLSSALPADMSQALMRAGPHVLASGKSAVVDFSLEDALGDQFFTGRLQTVPSESGQGLHLVALIRDVTVQIQAEARRQTMLDTLDLLEEAIVDMTPQGKLANVSAGWEKLRGGEKPECALHEQSLLQFVHPEDQGEVEAMLGKLEAGAKESGNTLRFRLHRMNGDYLWVEARLLAHRLPQGHVACIRGILRDVTASYLEQKRITQMALHDPLTNLPNRLLLHDHLQQAIVRAQRNGSKVALGFIDLDHFKQINDSLGHQAGDIVLQTLSQRLLSAMREMDTLCRWGGDEFVALLPDFNQESDLRHIAGRLMEAGRQAMKVEGQEVLPTLSIGFAVYPDDAGSAEALMAAADNTMFHAKRNGRNSVRFYSDVLPLAQLELLDHLI